MDSLRPPAGRRSASPTMKRTVLMFCGVLLLAAGFWTALLPAALAREATAADMIADQLPGRKTLKNASKSEFLDAVCAAVRKRRSAAAAITQAAVMARRESAGDIVEAVLRCSGKINCELVGLIVTAATTAEGDPVENRRRGNGRGAELCGNDSRSESARGQGKRSRRGRSGSGAGSVNRNEQRAEGRIRSARAAQSRL